MKIPIIPLFAIGSLLWAGHSVISSQPKHEPSDPPAMPPRSRFEKTVAAIGLVEPSSEIISIGSHRSGVVVEVYVSLWDQVKKDQPLIKLDTRDLEAELAVSKAQLEEAESQVQVAEAERAQAQRSFDYAAKLRDSRAISEEEITQRLTGLEITAARIKQTKAAQNLAQARIQLAETEIQRSTVRAPMAATVLQLKIRVGEFVSAAAASTAWLTLGETQTLHLRADVDEHEAWRIKSQAEATAHVRGNADLKSQLSFVRFEPLVIPKKSLTGDATERVDTRVLQVIYRLQNPTPAALFVGQQMDVFIAADTSTK
jgi:HlyD family secretion protein